MKDILSIKLVEYLRENNPDILFSLEEEGSLVSYINEKMEVVDSLLSQLQEQHQPEYIIEETCLEVLTQDLRPSKYNYIKELLEEEFIIEYHHLLRSGILRFEVINLISKCNPLFEAFEFSEKNEEDKNLLYTVIGTIKEYFENSENENRVSWPTMPAIN
jgi:hypothetical protein